MLTIGVDLDGVAYPFTIAFSKWWEDQGRGEMPSEPDRWHFWHHVGLSDAEFAEARDEFGEQGGYRMAAPYPEAIEALTAIFDGGADLIGVTSRTPSRAVEADTFGWISDWLVPVRAMLIGPTAKLEAEYDLLIDDDPRELERLADLGEASGLLLDRPWNQEARGFLRMGWAAIPGFIDEIALAVAGEAEGERRFVVEEMVADLLAE